MEFRIYPNNKSLYWRVIIHPSKKALTQTARELHKTSANPEVWKQANWRKADALTLTYDETIGTYSRAVGEIHFNEWFVTPEVIAHEMTHAAVNWGRRVNLHVDTDEEAIALAVGNMTQQFYDKAIKLRVRGVT